MSILGRLKVRTKLALLLGTFCSGMIAMVAISAFSQHRSMVDDRIAELKAAVDLVTSRAAALETRVEAQQMTRDQELEQLREMIHTMRFNNGSGYITLQRNDGFLLIHGTSPQRENKQSNATDSNGRQLIDLVHDALRKSDSGTVSYMFPKPGQTVPLPKVSYLKVFAPLNAFFLAGAYVDDLDADFREQLLSLAGLGGAILLVTLIAAWLINRDIAGSLGGLRSAMAGLAKGELATEIPGVTRQDEVGEMAAAVEVFRDSMIKTKDLTAEQERSKAGAAAAQKAALDRTADAFEAKIGSLVSTLSSAATELQATAQSMSETATQTTQQAAVV